MDKTKRNKIVYWIFTLWLSLGMVSTGLVQLMRTQEETDMFIHLGFPLYFLTIMGLSKMFGVVAVLIPRFPLLKEWAYAGFFFSMAGAITSHVIMGDGFSETFPPVLLLLLTSISWYFRPPDRRLLLVKNV